MNAKSWTITLIIIILTLGNCIQGYLLCKKHTQVNIEKVDSIEYSIDTLYITNDTLLNHVNDIQQSINSLESHYESDYISIVNQSIVSDYLFFRQYVTDWEHSRFVNKNNTETTQIN